MKLVTAAMLAAGLATLWRAPDAAAAAAAPTAPAELRGGETGQPDQPAPADGAEQPVMDAEAAAAQAEAERQAMIVEARTAALAAAPVEGAPVDPLVESAATYALYQRDLAAIRDRELAEPVDLDAVMDTLASYDSETLSAAFLSYGAFLAAQQPEFVDTVREAVDYYGADVFLRGLVNDPNYALTLDGAEETAEAVLNVLVDDIEALEDTAARFKQASYDLQSRGWRNMIAQDRDERLAKIRNSPRLSRPSEELIAGVSYGAPITPADAGQAAELRRTAFWEAIAYREAPEPALASRVTEGEYGRALGVVITLGAMRAIDQSAQRPDLVSQLLGVRTAPPACLDFSLLHMEQCVAAAHFKYEDAFCIAEHQLGDAARCLGEAVLEPTPELATPAPIHAESAEPVPAELDAIPGPVTTAEAAQDAPASTE